jgi:hypothetical protein
MRLVQIRIQAVLLEIIPALSIRRTKNQLALLAVYIAPVNPSSKNNESSIELQQIIE